VEVTVVVEEATVVAEAEGISLATDGVPAIPSPA